MVGQAGTDAVAANPVTAVDPGDARHKAPSARNRDVAAALVMGSLVHAGIRVWLSLPRNGPVVVADEINYLVQARYLSGGAGGELTGTVARPGYPLLIAPVFQFGADPSTTYVLALGMNAVLGAALFPLAYFLLGVMGPWTPRVRLAAAFVAAASPAFVFSSNFAMADAVLPTLVVALTASVVDVARRAVEGTPGAARLAFSVVMAVGMTGLIWMTHARGQLAAAGIVGVVMLVAVVRASWRGRAWILGYLLPAGAAVWAGRRLTAHTTRVLYGLDRSDLPAWDRMLPAKPEVVASSATGQLWTLIVASLGLTAIGLLTLFAGRTWRHRSVGVGTAVAVLGTAAYSGLTFARLDSQDFAWYGRYLDVFGPMLVAFGCAALLAGRVSKAMWVSVAVAIPALACVTVLLDPERAFAGDGRPFVTPVVALFSGQTPTTRDVFVDLTPVPLSVIALVGMAAMASGTWWRQPSLRAALPAGLAGAGFMVGAAAVSSIAYTLDALSYPEKSTLGDISQVADADVVLWDTADASLDGFRMRILYTSGSRLTYFDSTEETPPAGDVLITSAALPAPEGWELVGSAPEWPGLLVYRAPDD
jgi:hypothetical protein